MRLNKTLFLIVFAMILFQSCEKNESFPNSHYDCDFTFNDTSSIHPKAAIYQAVLEENQKNGLVGAVLLVKDKDGLWIGASGQADIASNINMKPCNTFLIASISKVYTSSAVYRYIDKGVLKMEDPISKWLSGEIVDKVANAKDAQIKHLLSHTSGIVDYYTDKFELDRENRVNNHFTKERVLTYVYGKKANFPVGETYGYCNTNYLLLSMILENASGKDFEAIYKEEIFVPLGLSSAYYSESKPIPDGCVRGYSDIYASGQLVDAQYLYQDELGIGGDGGIATNAYDLAVFLEQLMKGNLISSASLDEMSNWFDMPEDWHWDTYGQVNNGYGLERFDTDYGMAVGHTGGIDGFNTYGFYFPEQDMTYILFVNNTRAFNNSKDQIFKEVAKIMFE